MSASSSRAPLRTRRAGSRPLPSSASRISSPSTEPGSTPPKGRASASPAAQQAITSNTCASSAQ
jgi:hypothetical protein